MDYDRLAGWVVHLDQLADAPSDGIWFCQFVEQLAEAMCMPVDRPVAPVRPHYGHVPFKLRVRRQEQYLAGQSGPFQALDEGTG